MRHEFPGLPPTDLLSYLVGLGLGRVLALQSPQTEWAWQGDTLVIDTPVNDIPQFLVSDYQPTPVLSPWNNGSGFAPQDKNQRITLERLLAASDRLPDWQEAVQIGRRLRTSAQAGKDFARGEKELLIRLLRNQWPDRALAWLDSAVILTQDGPSFPPLLGSGGNDGRLDFSTHFHNNLVAVLPETGASAARSLGWASSLTSGIHVGGLASHPVGQFDASGAGSPRSGAFGGGRTLVNPWAYVLMLEGSLLFAAAPARRLGETTSRAAWPFTVSGSPEGPNPGSANEEVRGELWAPTWSQPSNLLEIQQVFAEARATWAGSSAKQSAHMYGAVRSLGTDRRIGRFIRFGLAQRNGLAFLAVPLDDVRVEAAPGIGLAIPVSRRMQGMQRAESQALGIARRRADRRLSDFMRHTRPEDLLLTLEALTLWELALTRSNTGRDKVTRLPNRMPARDVLAICRPLFEESAEVRLGAALAGGRTWLGAEPISTRDVVLGTVPDRTSASGWRAPKVGGLASRPLVDVLSDTAVWCEQHGAVASMPQDSIGRGARLVSGSSVVAAWQDTHAWARGELDEAYLQTAFLAFLALDWNSPGRLPPHRERPQIPVPELSLLQRFNSARVRLPGDSKDAARVQGLMPGWLLRLRAGQVSPVLAEATALLNRSKVAEPPFNQADGHHSQKLGEPDQESEVISAPAEYAAPVSISSGPRLAAALMASLTPPIRRPRQLTDSAAITTDQTPTQEAQDE
ncbi:MAG: type I-U CRISPR-associated protein Csx17 [Propionibacteriaceae bacterium]|nr:type I-U CRISPR-associated protein Csx17 [Propionibacteriaceae bacterium]